MLNIYIKYNIISSYKKGGNLRALLCAVFVSWFLLSAGVAGAQSYSDCTSSNHPIYVDSLWKFPDTVCAGKVVPFSVGYDTSNTMVLAPDVPTVRKPDTMFIPNAAQCDCSHSSTITVSGYSGSILDANSIKYVRLKIKHGHAADLNIRLVCPDSTRVNIFKAYNPILTNVNCVDPYFSYYDQWGYPYLGALNQTILTNSMFARFGSGINDPDPCDPTNPQQSAQGGWNYYWSNNSNFNYPFSQPDSLIYHTPSFPVPWDTSLFYHPDDNFHNLTGCPINGPWTIEITDGIGTGGSNGYLFDWEIVFDPTLAGPSDPVDSAAVLLPGDPSNAGNWAADTRFERTSDTSFVLHAPSNISDTLTITDTLRVYDPVSHCWYDTTITIVVTPPTINGLPNQTICAGETITLNAGPCEESQNSQLSQDFSAITTGGDRWHSHSHATAGGQIYYGPGNTEVDSFPDYVSAMLNFPERTKVFPAGGRVKLGNSEPATGSMTSVPLSLPHPFAVDVRAKGWGAVPGSSESPKRTRVNVVVDKGQPTQQVRTFETDPAYHWPGDSAYRDYTLLGVLDHHGGDGERGLFLRHAGLCELRGDAGSGGLQLRMGLRHLQLGQRFDQR